MLRRNKKREALTKRRLEKVEIRGKEKDDRILLLNIYLFFDKYQTIHK